MGKDKPSHKEPDLEAVQVRIKKDEREKALDQGMKDLPHVAPDLQLVKFLELEDEIRDEVRQDKF
jgi:hypothetical protein